MKTVVYSVLGVFLVAVTFGALWYFFLKPPIPFSQQGTDNSFGTPAGSVTTTPTTLPGNMPSSLTLTLRNGTQVSVPDFTKQNQPATANAENGFQIAGSATSTFHILYFPHDFGVLISLYAEPLGATRLVAEKALRAAFGLSDVQLCDLTVDVRTPIGINSLYAGKNLGFSFCPGATVLPE